jgi:hypothetical protein
VDGGIRPREESLVRRSIEVPGMVVFWSANWKPGRHESQETRTSSLLQPLVFRVVVACHVVDGGNSPRRERPEVLAITRMNCIMGMAVHQARNEDAAGGVHSSGDFCEIVAVGNDISVNENTRKASDGVAIGDMDVVDGSSHLWRSGTATSRSSDGI